MSSGSFSLIGDALAVTLTGFCVKLLDDHLDREMDVREGKGSFAVIFGGGLLPYSVLALAIASLLNARLASSLVLSCWAIGMLHERHRRFGLGLPGYAESLMVVVIGGILSGFSEMFSSIVATFCIQIVDDIIDYTCEPFVESRNLIRRLGRHEAYLLAFVAVTSGFLLDARKLLLVSLGAAMVFFAERKIVRRGGEGYGT